MTDSSRLHQLKIDRKRTGGKSPLPWILLVAVLVLLAAAGVYVLVFKGASVVEVQTAAVRESNGSGNGGGTVLNASGYVTARRQATVSAKTTGKIVEVLIEEGMKVKEGQVLARLDSKNVEASRDLAAAQVESAKAAVQEMQALLEEAETRLKRIRALAEDRIASESELDRVSSEANSLRARLERAKKEVVVAERQVEVWTRQLEDLVIRAPFEGVVVSKDAQPGEMISPVSAGGGFTRTGVCTIVDMDSLEIEVDVNESYIKRVKPDQPVTATLDSYPDWKIPARVIAIIPTADRQKATVQVRIGFNQLDERILPDMGVKTAFQDASNGEAQASSRLTVPENAMVRDDNKSYVWVVDGDDTVERRAITAGATNEGRVAILAGLRASEQVVVNPSEALKDGDSVQMKEQ